MRQRRPACAKCRGPTDAQVAELSPQGLKDRLDRDEAIAVLDVREPHERDHAKIALPQTVTDLFVPIGQVSARLEEIRGAIGNRPLVVYCHHGQRSMMVATWLMAQGVADVSNLDGGIEAWSRRVDPSVRRY